MTSILGHPSPLTSPLKLRQQRIYTSSSYILLDQYNAKMSQHMPGGLSPASTQYFEAEGGIIEDEDQDQNQNQDIAIQSRGKIGNGTQIQQEEIATMIPLSSGRSTFKQIHRSKQSSPMYVSDSQEEGGDDNDKKDDNDDDNDSDNKAEDDDERGEEDYSNGGGEDEDKKMVEIKERGQKRVSPKIRSDALYSQSGSDRGWSPVNNPSSFADDEESVADEDAHSDKTIMQHVAGNSNINNPSRSDSGGDANWHEHQPARRQRPDDSEVADDASVVDLLVGQPLDDEMELDNMIQTSDVKVEQTSDVKVGQLAPAPKKRRHNDQTPSRPKATERFISMKRHNLIVSHVKAIEVKDSMQKVSTAQANTDGQVKQAREQIETQARQIFETTGAEVRREISGLQEKLALAENEIQAMRASWQAELKSKVDHALAESSQKLTEIRGKFAEVRAENEKLKTLQKEELKKISVRLNNENMDRTKVLVFFISAVLNCSLISLQNDRRKKEEALTKQLSEVLEEKKVELHEHNKF